MAIDLDNLTFTPGQVIESGENKWEVVSYEDNVLKIKPISMTPHMSSYLMKGAIYTLEEHQPQSYMRLWEIPPEQMMRDSSQVLLYWWGDNSGGSAGPSIDIDF